MSLKVLHTADLHLGMTFGNRNYPEAVRQQLVEARYQTLELLVELAKTHAESEYEKYRIVQDRLFESDFDRMVKQIESAGEEKSEEE